MGSKSFGKNRVCNSENKEIGHRLRDGWLVILGLFPSLASTGPKWGLQEEIREGARETETLRSESLTELKKEHKNCV